MSFLNDVKTRVETFLEGLPEDLAKAEAEATNLEAAVAAALPKVEALVALAEKDAPALLPYLEDLLAVLKVV